MLDKVAINKHATLYADSVSTWVTKNIDSDFNLATVHLDWDTSRRSSRGGMYAKGPGINIAMAYSYPQGRKHTFKFHEYASYAKDPVIGDFYSNNPVHYLNAVVVHEIAHAIQWFMYKKYNTRCKPHGPMFKKYYAILRKEFINIKLPNQAALKKDYENYVSTINNIGNIKVVKVTNYDAVLS